MKIDIVIPCSTEDKCVLNSIRSIQKCAHSNEYIQNIFVVFNPTVPTWSAELRQIDSRTQPLVSPFRNVNRARNFGLQNSKTEICLFLDADCEVDYDLITRHIQLHQQHPDVTAIGGLYSNLKCTAIVQNVYDWLQKKWLLEGLRISGNNPNLLGGNVSYKRSLLGQNQFCPEISFGASETELHYRLYRENHKLILNPSLIVHHNSNVTMLSLLKKAFLQGRNSSHLTAGQRKEQKILSLDFLYFIENKPKGFLFSFLIFAFVFAFKTGQQRSKSNLVKSFYLTLKSYTSEALIRLQDHGAAYAIRNEKIKR